MLVHVTSEACVEGEHCVEGFTLGVGCVPASCLLLPHLRRISVHWADPGSGFPVGWYDGRVNDYSYTRAPQPFHTVQRKQINIFVHEIIFDGESDPVFLDLLGCPQYSVSSLGLIACTSDRFYARLIACV